MVFAALSALFFLVSAGTFSSLGVLLPAMVRDLHWNWTQAGLGYAFLGVACGLSSCWRPGACGVWASAPP